MRLFFKNVNDAVFGFQNEFFEIFFKLLKIRQQIQAETAYSVTHLYHISLFESPCMTEIVKVILVDTTGKKRKKRFFEWFTISVFQKLTEILGFVAYLLKYVM